MKLEMPHEDAKPTDMVVVNAHEKTNALIREYIDLDKQVVFAKDILKEHRAKLKELVECLGVGAHFQDEEGVVYQIAEIDGKYVYFDPIDIKRTRRPDEKKGSMSMTEARALGYVVEGK